MNICFRFEHVFNDRSTDVENSYALRALLDCLVAVNIAYLKRNRVSRLYSAGVKYDRTKLWYPIPELYQRGNGDCKSLTAALVAEYLVQGVKAKPVFRFYPNPGGGYNFHILVMVPEKNGYEKKLFEDPSRRLGMGRHETSYF